MLVVRRERIQADIRRTGEHLGVGLLRKPSALEFPRIQGGSPKQEVVLKH